LTIVDAQVHAWEPSSAAYPWDQDSVNRLPARFLPHFRDHHRSAEQVVAMMDAVGVEAAVLTSPTIYGMDHRYSFNAANHYPGRFGVVGPVDPAFPKVEDRIRQLHEEPWGMGVRVIVRSDPLDGPGLRTIFATSQECGIPVVISANERLNELPHVARAFPELVLIIDHLGVSPTSDRSDPLAIVPELIKLARFENIAVKCVAAPLLSKQPYPFKDLWPRLHQVIEAFGPERVMWGSDITVHVGDLTYCEAVDYMRRTDELSEADRTLILGKAARALLGWPSETQPTNSSESHDLESPPAG
jgi:predicted TIM-barrel fold metal-dependent hydrolase